MKTIFVVALVALAPILTSASVIGVEENLRDFLEFEHRFNKVYDTETERNRRFEVFRQNLAEIRQHNSQQDVSYIKGINQFADLTADEFRSIHLGGYIKTGMGSTAGAVSSNNLMAQELPSSVDWRTKGVISDIKNQGNCGSCWAHSTIEQLESYLALATGNMTKLSVQELVSCMPNVLECGGTGGCFGATNEMAFQWIQSFGLVA